MSGQRSLKSREILMRSSCSLKPPDRLGGEATHKILKVLGGKIPEEPNIFNKIEGFQKTLFKVL
ncbi:hypothetical protein BpHYR1_006323 [Brachionus plicatilis]|uniref:Uncharacterized protein n=1 Tax=Brachionus plicatilis TaxID=10195 RepID=A0A3M7QJ86_BRAPC|nr:hypothetical protein BpHYR1_006323 [Brachionus plicatilis]